MQKPLDTLLQREMTRKEFIAAIGFGVASVMGVGSIIKFVKPSFGSSLSQPTSSQGYGTSAYGR
jgi:hypothetical protein